MQFIHFGAVLGILVPQHTVLTAMASVITALLSIVAVLIMTTVTLKIQMAHFTTLGDLKRALEQRDLKLK